MKRFFQLPWRTRRDIARDVDDEIRFHLDARTAELVASGMSPEEAGRQVLRQFGDLEGARREIETIDRGAEVDRRRRDLMGDSKQDIGYALRSLGKAPAFTLTALLALSLGIGANTAIFSFVNGVLLRPLPFPHSEQLVRVWSANPVSGNLRVPASPMDLDDWRRDRRVLSDLGGYFYQLGGSGMDLTGSGEPQRLSVAFVTAGFFSTLGVNAELGRLPRDEELQYGGPNQIAVLSRGFWQRQFGSSPTTVNSTILLNGAPYQVIGIMPAGFSFPADNVDAWVPYVIIPESSIPRVRGVRILGVVGRLAPGATIAQAEGEMSTEARRLAEQYPDNGQWTSATVTGLQAAITGPVHESLLVLWGAVGFVLLMACVNVAGLLLARAGSREREIAIRASLGGTRGRIIRQLLTESVVLALAGGIAGIGVAQLALHGLLRLAAGQIPRAGEIRLDATVLAFAVILSVVTGLVFGVVPALRASATNLQRTLREGGRGLVSGVRLRNGLVIAEVALAALLVVGAGLMTRSFVRLLRTDPGFQPEQLVAVQFTISTVRHGTSTDPRQQSPYALYYHEVIERVRALPGVISAAAVKDPPFRGTGEPWSFTPAGTVFRTGEQRPTANAIHISDGYFRTIGAPVLAGREFTPQDRFEGPFVVLINQALAKKFFPNQDPVGQTLDLGPQTRGSGPAQIIGVVGDIRQSAIESVAEPAVYVNNMIDSRVRTTLLVRTQGNLLAMAQRVRDAIWSVDKDQTITAIFTFNDLMGEAVARPRMLAVLLGIFGGLALGLGALGIYGLLAYVVSQRTREIGVRLALGANKKDVLGMIVGRGMGLAGIGLAIGLPAALYLSAFLRNILYGVRPADPMTFVLVVLALLVTAALASYLPARRAAGTDPAVTLRSE